MSRPVHAEQLAHPLDPISAQEITVAVATLRRDGLIGPSWRIASVEIVEPSKTVVRAFAPGDQVTRQATVVCWNREDAQTYKAIVDLDSAAIVPGCTVQSWQHQPGKQANATVDEWHDCAIAMLANVEVVTALAGRGVKDLSLVLIDMWTFGAHLVPQRYAGRRIGWCDIWVREEQDSNPYAHLVSGLKLIVDLNSMALLEIDDAGGAGPAPVMGEYVARQVERRLPGLVQRADLAPLQITQPDGVSFTLTGQELRWQNWRMRIGFNYREGLVLHQVAFADPNPTAPSSGTGAEPEFRSVAHRLSLAEMVVPYRDPSPDHWRRTAYDIGEWGLGFMTTSLKLGCDCLGEIRYLDAVLHDTAGEPYTIENAICLHEEDNAVLWKHVDERSGTETRRMRRMVISAHMTVANYEYLIYWRFYQDGSIECEIRATGILVTTPYDGEPPPYGIVVDTRTYAPIHQHFLVARLDLEVDGPDNTVVMTETQVLPTGPGNEAGLGLTQVSVPLLTEQQGCQNYCWETQRAWKVINPGRLNHVGSPTAYKLVPGAAIPPMIDRESPVFRRAEVIGHTLWVTAFDADERWPCGEFVNQGGPGDGLPQWISADRSIDNTDVVLWYVFGIHHVPRVEDWPVMPADTVSFWLKPAGFFDRNPALDAPSSTSPHCG